MSKIGYIYDDKENSYVGLAMSNCGVSELEAEQGVAKFLSEQLAESFEEVHVEDVPSIAVALKCLFTAFEHFLEDEPELKAKYDNLEKNVTSIMTISEIKED